MNWKSKCPYCESETTCDTVDVGVGYVQCGPFCCDYCGASEIGPEWDEAKVQDSLDEDEKRTGYYKNRISPLANQKDGKVISHQEADAIYRAEYFNKHGNPYNAPVFRGGDPAEPKPDHDEESEEYHKFVESRVPHCHCRERDRPCDGVLAGGMCDNIQDSLEEEFEEQEEP